MPDSPERVGEVRMGESERDAAEGGGEGGKKKAPLSPAKAGKGEKALTRPQPVAAAPSPEMGEGGR